MVSFLDIHKQMKLNSVALFFKGYVTFELIDSIILIVSERLELMESNVNVRKKVYGVLTECLQNLCNHIEENPIFEQKSEYDLHSAIIMIDSDNDTYQIKTGNFVSNDKVKGLEEALIEINNADKDQLKEMYNNILKQKTFSEKGGAGLGLIDMARKSGNKLIYTFEKVDDKYSFFSFQITIGRIKQ
jgi:hypothetical protein